MNELSALAQILLRCRTAVRVGCAVALLHSLPSAALADDARGLRIEAAALVQAAQNAELGSKERQALLEQAHSKLFELQERFPSASAELQIFLGGKRVRLSADDVLREAELVRKEAASIRLTRLEVGKLREVLGRSPSPAAVDENGWTDLHWAAVLNLPELAEALLDAGAEVEARLNAFVSLSGSLRQSFGRFGLALDDLRFGIAMDDFIKSGGTPLHWAAWSNASEVAALLVEHGADIHAKDSYGSTPLLWATWSNTSEVAALLIERGADIHAKDPRGWTPLHSAAWSNTSEVAALLIERGADIHAKDPDGRTPLHEAASESASEVVALLVEHGADIHAKDNEGRTPLHWAARSNAPEAAALLIERGADIHAKDAEGRTPLAVAAEGNAQKVLALLKKRQKDIEDRLASMDIGRLREVLDRSLSPTAVDENGWTDLHWAATLNLPELAGVLLDVGADVEAQLKYDGEPLSDSLRQSLGKFGLATDDFRRNGGTPLHWAARSNAPEAAALLTERGADIHKIDIAGWTPLHWAARSNAPEAAALLIERGADIHAKNSKGWTPLHWAARSNASEAAALLIERGADIHAKDAKGRTP